MDKPDHGPIDRIELIRTPALEADPATGTPARAEGWAIQIRRAAALYRGDGSVASVEHHRHVYDANAPVPKDADPLVVKLAKALRD